MPTLKAIHIAKTLNYNFIVPHTKINFSNTYNIYFIDTSLQHTKQKP